MLCCKQINKKELWAKNIKILAEIMAFETRKDPHSETHVLKCFTLFFYDWNFKYWKSKYV
jgi:hypothetical protein